MKKPNSEDFLSRRLQVFSAVATLLSFTKAANALHMTQPAVTFQVRQLEESFNCKLFVRAHNKVSLTNEGQIMVGYISDFKKSFQEKDKLDDTIRTIEDSIGIPLTNEDGSITKEAFEVINHIADLRNIFLDK